MISVAIATFNGQNFLPAQLDSILAQSVAVDEIVICDDNSTDGTGEILADYQRKYPGKFRIFHNPENLGCAGNVEKALSFCNGGIIFLADQDDVWKVDKVEKMLKCFSTPQILGVYSDSLVVNSQLEPLGQTHLEIRGFSPALLAKTPQFKNFVRRVPPAAHDMAIRRSALKYLLIFFFIKEFWQFCALIASMRRGKVLNGALMSGKISTTVLFSSLGLMFMFPGLSERVGNILAAISFAFLLYAFGDYVCAYFGKHKKLYDLE